MNEDVDSPIEQAGLVELTPEASIALVRARRWMRGAVAQNRRSDAIGIVYALEALTYEVAAFRQAQPVEVVWDEGALATETDRQVEQ